ncbi:hypothetical protein C3747_46g27 [Trypanosoma cruzi]|uniref:AAA+ ATPase domain-containing protein n=2 Tax=Trypanosoma cruzi TaxID=5693 RepID=Q4D6G4_TRYCC|nr:hypothetical protein, conserved [Trypanosoma cruzi]EAN88121.1 hypothetical protein, conserved [Trypanosoma cruzi]PWV13003.1 hypothetical protein C3747_46g27 [Trypanosoma cruzi]RNC55350.1 hypothetical protein TcCL_ESM07180 [Trypanosoma cruzi]|eukprot:XP_809972.1 hypothetical protein [Trypanosoma cruzi strain CL Brener]
MSARRLFTRGIPVATMAIAVCIVIFLIFPASSLRPLPVAAEGEEVERRCPRCPICSARGTPFFLRLRYCVLTSLPAVLVKREFSVEKDEKLRHRVMEDVKELLLTRLVGQEHVKGAILEAVRRKLIYPRDPLVLHFAGDNGVGKTHTARLLSLATSPHCAPSRPACDMGENMLVISGTGFDGMPIEDARTRIIQRVTAHQKVYPHGIVLLDDLAAMHPKLVAALAPLLGRAERFEEQPEDTPSLAQLIVVVTTDFGKQGRTWGKSMAEIEQLVRDEFAGLYGTLLSAFTRTMLFLPFSRHDAEEMIRIAVAALPCGTYWNKGAVVTSSIEDLAVTFLVERHRETWEGKENGHSLRRAVEDSLVSLLLQYFDQNGHDKFVWAHFRLDERAAKIVLSTGWKYDHMETSSEEFFGVATEAERTVLSGEEKDGGGENVAERGKHASTLNEDL